LSQIYFISGLGADERVFGRLKLTGTAGIIIRWEQPLEGETIQHYAQRLTGQISTTEEVILIGVSFGGIIAQEISKLLPCKKVIIISSIKSHHELSWLMRLVRISRLNRLFPAPLLKMLGLLVGPYFFNARTPEDRQLLISYIRNTDPLYLRWSTERLLQWESTASPPDLHIHGTSDRIFPFSYIKNAIAVKGGGHFMTLDRANEVSDLINQLLRQT
jgi:pimeloyl-ACP methyl ester carboxylesterase